jgi:hypothetical protein
VRVWARWRYSTTGSRIAASPEGTSIVGTLRRRNLEYLAAGNITVKHFLALKTHRLRSFSPNTRQVESFSSEARALASVAMLLRRYTGRHDFVARLFASREGTRRRASSKTIIGPVRFARYLAERRNVLGLGFRVTHMVLFAKETNGKNTAK